ncbi:metalloregulator ArsR/SmtB family transcription factor [Myxococcota bacterium]|nr:metalloregulator ArsR/SmtB family transcription factor [Myxococcota bacterium]MBU1429075.1 metalloregulator ArsR/SmtB family transcription factor [Myxococcota bacterium]MBU1899863.1 metalloregulator ArsR/SmtB family transcription factor [Myxococcota bacterium]
MQIFKALGHAQRLRIVELLCHGDWSVGLIAARLDLKPAIVSQQLRILRLSGIAGRRLEGGNAIYSLTVPCLRALIASVIEHGPREA